MSNPITSSFCTFGECAQVGRTEHGDVVVSSTRLLGRVHFSAAEWEAFLAGVRAGEFDLDKL